MVTGAFTSVQVAAVRPLVDFRRTPVSEAGQDRATLSPLIRMVSVGGALRDRRGVRQRGGETREARNAYRGRELLLLSDGAFRRAADASGVKPAMASRGVHVQVVRDGDAGFRRIEVRLGDRREAVVIR
jgi:hypothetical protein